MKIRTTNLDHVVYEGEASLLIGGQAIRLRQGTPAPAGSVSICLIADASIHDLYDRADELHAEHGSVHPRTAATAPTQAITLVDPDGYHVELATYTPEGAPIP